MKNNRTLVKARKKVVVLMGFHCIPFKTASSISFGQKPVQACLQ